MSSELKAAFGKVNITPTEISPLQGYNPEKYIADPDKDVLDDLYARILILSDGNTKVAIVSIDCCMTNEQAVQVPLSNPGVFREFIATFPEGTRASWARAAGVDGSHITVNATHTHSAPAQFSSDYTSRIEAEISKTAEQLVPVNVSIADGESHISAFRRPTLKADLSVPINRSLHVVHFESLDGVPLGNIVNYAVHPTAVGRPKNRISGDIVGLAMGDVEIGMSEDYVSLFLQGLSGDICPMFGVSVGTKVDTYPDVIRGSRILSEDITSAIKRKRMLQSGSQLKANTKVIHLQTKEGLLVDRMPVTLMGISWGELFLLSISGEVFNEYVEMIENVSPFHHTLISGVANGYSGYIPTQKAFKDGLGGYEMNTTPYTELSVAVFLQEVEGFLLAFGE